MNKKILSLALSGMLACSAVFGLAACKPQNGGNTGGTNNGTNSGTNGNNGNTNTIKPGTVITDEKVTGSLFSALSKAELTGLTYSGSVDLSVAEGTTTTEQKISLEGALRLGESMEGDAYLSISGEGGLLYLLGFLRDGGAYYTMGEAEGKTVDFSALKTQLKAQSDPLLLEKAEAGVVQSIFAAPATVKLLKNAASLFSGVITKTEGGYSLVYDIAEGAAGLLAGAQEVAGAIEETAELTLSGLFSQKFVDDTLTTLLNGITAKELEGFIELLPEEIAQNLPARANGTAKEYLLGLLRSGEFYTSVVGEGEPWSDYRTFGEIPLAEIVSFLTGGEVDLSTLKLKDMLKDLVDNLENKVVSLLLPFVDLEGGVENESLDLSLTFSFDDDKKLLGFSLDALAEGNVTEAPQEQQPDGGTQPEDGNGDAMTAAAPVTKVHFSAKLNTTCAQSPELFDLKGCKYQGENGAVTIK